MQLKNRKAVKPDNHRKTPDEWVTGLADVSEYKPNFGVMIVDKVQKRKSVEYSSEKDKSEDKRKRTISHSESQDRSYLELS